MVRRAQYERTRSLIDLRALIPELEARGEWDLLCHYQGELFRETKSVVDAERWANALSMAGKSEELLAFLQENLAEFPSSRGLQLCYVWSLYEEGRFVEARAELAKLPVDWSEPSQRTLELALGIGSGDWNSLASLVARDYERRGDLGAKDLIRSAELALALRFPYGRELLFAAATRGQDDAEVLARAHTLALRADLESAPEVSDWLRRAAELSGEDGPVRRADLQEILGFKAEWGRRESKAWSS